MVFPEHMEFRYYITPERKEHFVLYDRTLGSRMTYLELTQDLGQCLIDLYDTDFYDAYCVLSEINKLVQTEKNEAAWRKLLELSLPLCKVHPFFGLLAKELSELESAYAHGQDADAALVLSFANDFEAIVRDAKALIEVCLDDRYKPDYSTAERYREAHYDALLHFDDMRYGELATEEVMLDSPAYNSAYHYSVEILRERGIKTALREVLYPNTVRDLYNYLKAYCLRLPLPIHKCKNCGRYFAVMRHGATEYCGRVADERGRTCREVGAINTWTRSKRDDEVFKVYRREYKKRFAWIKAGRITDQQFYDWSERARAEKDKCEQGLISQKELEVWLKESK